MTSKERVMAALRLEEPDRVPHGEGLIDPGLYEKLTGGVSDIKVDVAPSEIRNSRGKELAESQKKLAKAFELDIINYPMLAPVFVGQTLLVDGRKVVGNGIIRTRDNLEFLKLPDPTALDVYSAAEEFCANKGEYAAALQIRLGIGSTLISMGLDGFAYAMVDDPELVEIVLSTYVDWSKAAVESLVGAGFDLVWAFDDVAGNLGPLFSPKLYREMVIPHLMRAAQAIRDMGVPWISHSDGDMNPILEDWLSLGQNGIHPIQPDVMDIFALKKKIAHRVCLVGNIEMAKLSFGTPEEVRAEVSEKLACVGKGGGYIISSSNSLTSEMNVENVQMMLKLIREQNSRQ
jgi:uroporphyrinogen decarboxylase